MNNKPKIICHMISSVDGRLSMSQWSAPAETEQIPALVGAYEETAGRFHADGWLCGRVTMEDFTHGMPLAADASGIDYENYVAPHEEGGFVVSVDPHGKLHYGRNKIGGSHLIAVLGTEVPREYLAELRAEGISYIFAGTDGRDIPLMLDTLYTVFGIRTLLLEGGAVINGAFLAAGAIDELSLLIYPGLDGNAAAPSIFEYKGEAGARPAGKQSLRLRTVEQLPGGMLWLRYDVEPSTPEAVKTWEANLLTSCDCE